MNEIIANLNEVIDIFSRIGAMREEVIESHSDELDIESYNIVIEDGCEITYI